MDLITGTATGVLATIIVLVTGWIWREVRKRRQPVRRSRALARRLVKAGVSNFYASRADYVQYRGAPTLTAYLRTASKTIDIAAYWMASGNEAENIAHEICSLVETKRELRARVAIIDPTSDYLGALADYLGIPPIQLQQRLTASLTLLDEARSRLGEAARRRLELKVYRTLPVSSVVMLDVAEPNGRIQLDLKAFRAPRSSSFGLEIVSGGELFNVCRQAWTGLIDEAEVLDAKKHLESV